MEHRPKCKTVTTKLQEKKHYNLEFDKHFLDTTAKTPFIK